MPEEPQALRFQRRLGARAHVELAVDLLHVVGNGVPAQAQLHADLGQRVALGHTQQHLAFAVGQVDAGSVACRLRLGLGAEIGHHAARDARAQRRFALADALQLFGDQLARLLLQDVAEGAGLQRREQVFVVVVDGDHHALRIGLHVAQLGHHVHAAAVGQAQVDERQVELHRAHQFQRVVHARAFRDGGIGKHLQHQLAQPGPDFGQVFEQQDGLHGGGALCEFMLSAYRPRSGAFEWLYPAEA
jgi:hypothetical protein